MNIENLDICVPAKRLKVAASEEYWINNIFREGVNKTKFAIQLLPPELITNILEYLPSRYLLTVVRLISREFQDIVHDIIHRRFFMLSKKLCHLYSHSNRKLKVPTPILIKLGEHDLVHYVEMISIQYCILRASIWRYMKNGSSGLVLSHCSGTILDAFENIMSKIEHEPQQLQVNCNRCQDVDNLCNLVRGFINRFEDMVEAKVNTNCFVSGAKVVDLLDSALYIKHNILSENYENGFCKLKVNYRFHGAWFNTSEIRNAFLPHYSWEEDQRLMYNRLRRLVVTSTNFCSALANSNLKTKLDPDRKAFYNPSIGAYAATEEYANRSYYYGCMIPGIYRPLTSNTAEDDCLILDIKVNLVCPLRYAPLSVYKRFCMDLETKYLEKHIAQKSTRLQAAKFNMTVQFKCDLGYETKYTSKFNLVISEEQRVDHIYKNN